MKLPEKTKLVPCLSKTDSRFATECGQYKDGTLAITNGRVLVIHKDVSESPVKCLIDRETLLAIDKAKSPVILEDDCVRIGKVRYDHAKGSLTFPHWKPIVPESEESNSVILLDAKLLLDLARGLGAPGNIIRLEINPAKTQDPIRVTTSNSDALGVIMPCTDTSASNTK